MARTHTCPGGCGLRTCRFACTGCWYRLPVPLRRALALHTRKNTTARSLAMHAAVTWYTEHESTMDSAAS